MDKRYSLLLCFVLCFPALAYGASLPIEVFNDNSIEMSNQPVVFGAVPLPKHLRTAAIDDLRRAVVGAAFGPA